MTEPSLAFVLIEAACMGGVIVALVDLVRERA